MVGEGGGGKSETMHCSGSLVLFADRQGSLLSRRDGVEELKEEKAKAAGSREDPAELRVWPKVGGHTHTLKFWTDGRA